MAKKERNLSPTRLSQVPLGLQKLIFDNISKNGGGAKRAIELAEADALLSEVFPWCLSEEGDKFWYRVNEGKKLKNLSPELEEKIKNSTNTVLDRVLKIVSGVPKPVGYRKTPGPEKPVEGETPKPDLRVVHSTFGNGEVPSAIHALIRAISKQN
jgi:hypothetical protein